MEVDNHHTNSSIAKTMHSISRGQWYSGISMGTVIYIITCIGLYKIFVKAGKEGWKAFIPIYNLIILYDIIDKPCWWILLLLIPVVDVIIHVIVMCTLGDCFQRSCLFKLGLILCPTLFFLILGFDNSRYISPNSPQQFNFQA